VPLFLNALRVMQKTAGGGFFQGVNDRYTVMDTAILAKFCTRRAA